jgi:hypothetical protein
MAQKNTLFNYFTKSPAQSKIQNGGSPQTNDNVLHKANAATPSSAGKKATKKTPAKIDSKKNTKATTPVTGGNKQNEGKGN